MTTLTHRTPSYPSTLEPAAMPPFVTPVATLAGVTVLAAGMAEWNPGDWAAFAGTLLFVGGAALGGLLKLLSALKQFRTDLQAGVRQAARAAPLNAQWAMTKALDASAIPTTPEQRQAEMQELARLVAAELRKPETPRVQT